jgi:glycosyltransferase involved in cell wall biosynthesis
MEPTVSIIVPVYNAEDYIRRCIDSIIRQDFEDFELLLIDDGSTDSSGAICDQYQQNDPRIRVVHKKNAGVSAARNTALDLARGTYLQFLDSDDWITPEATRLFVRAADSRQCDLIIADFYRVVDERLSQKGDIEEDRVLTREEYAACMMENPADYYYGVLWNKLYRREIIEQYHLRMDESVHWCEDFLFNLEYILHAERFYALKTPIYYYVKRKGSLVGQNLNISRTIQMKLSMFEYYNDFYKNVYDEKDYERNRLQVYRFLVDAANDSLVLPSILPHVKKLGEERINTNLFAASGDSILAAQYRSRKLFEHYMETVATKNEFSLKEVKLLFYLSQLSGPISRKDLADFAGTTLSSLTITLQRLVLKNMVKITGEKGDSALEKACHFELLSAASPVLCDLNEALSDLQKIQFSGFSAEEMSTFKELQKKQSANFLKALQAY